MDNMIGLYAIRDDVSGFTDPITFATDFEARNSFGNVLDALLSAGKSVKTYTLYRIGDFNVNSGLIVPLVPPSYIAAASDYNLTLKGVDGGEVSPVADA